MTTTHNLQQGTPAWDAFRLQHHGASEAAAMLGLSKLTTRTELLNIKKTGLPREFAEWVQRNVLDHGHAVEKAALPHIEALIGQSLYPVTCSLGKLSASCDGLTIDDEIAMEHKQWSESLAERMLAGEFPEEHMPQCQQVAMVTGARRVIFVVSDGTPEKMLHMWVEPDSMWFGRIRDGWDQFDRDLAEHVVVEPTIAPTGRAPDSLPALHIVLRGEVSASNLAEFKDVALTAIRSVNRDLKTDQDFADSAKARKWCEDIEARVAAAKDHALSQTVSIDLLFKTMDEVSNEAREVRLALEKLEKARKETRKAEIVATATRALAEHVAGLDARLQPTFSRVGVHYMPATNADFGAAVRGLKTFDSMQNAVDTALANAKIVANATADRIDVNLKHLNAEAADFLALFPDVAALVLKDPQDFAAQVQFRVATQRAKYQKKADDLRESIAAEEKAKAEAAVAAAAVVQTAAAPPPAAAPITPTAAVTPLRTTAISAPAAAAPAAGAAPTLSVGQIGTRLGFALPAAFLESLGFEPTRNRGSVLFHESEFEPICQALIEHIHSVIETQAA